MRKHAVHRPRFRGFKVRGRHVALDRSGNPGAAESLGTFTMTS